jgi:hypothetical protein
MLDSFAWWRVIPMLMEWRAGAKIHGPRYRRRASRSKVCTFLGPDPKGTNFLGAVRCGAVRCRLTLLPNKSLALAIRIG